MDISHTEDHGFDTKETKDKNNERPFFHKGLLIYPIILFIFSLIFGVSMVTGSANAVTHKIDENGLLDGLGWDINSAPETMEERWSLDGFQEIVNTPGAIIGVKEKGLYRLDSETGETLWEYSRDDAFICDAANTNDDITAVFNSGNGCSEIVTLESATGKYKYTAEYATDQNTAKLINQAGDTLLLTPTHARLLRNDLVTKSEFGEQLYQVNYSDQLNEFGNKLTNCNINDGAINADGYAIVAICGESQTYKIYYLNDEPEESTMNDIVFTIDTRSQYPSTIAAMSKAMISYVTQGNNPGLHVHQLTKDLEEVSHQNIEPNEYGFEYQDFPGIGYVWRVGDAVKVKYGSEDLSSYEEIENAIGDPILAGDSLLVPMLDNVVVWNTLSKEIKDVPVAGLHGTKFAFSGSTIVSYDNGVVRGYN